MGAGFRHWLIGGAVLLRRCGLLRRLLPGVSLLQIAGCVVVRHSGPIIVIIIVVVPLLI